MTRYRLSRRLLGRVVRIGKAVHNTAAGRITMRLFAANPAVRWLVLVAAVNASVNLRRIIIDVVQRVNGTAAAKRAFVDVARKFHEMRRGSAERIDCYALSLAYSGNAGPAWSLLSSDEVRSTILDPTKKTNLFASSVALCFELALYRRATEVANLAVQREPRTLRARYDYLKAAFAAGQLRNERKALEFFGRQYNLIDDWTPIAAERDFERVIAVVHKQTLHTITPEVIYQRLRLGRMARTAIFFLSSTEALGHAILDPYHFIALNRSKFEQLIFIGPPKARYRTASAACLPIIEQYGTYVETGSDILWNLSWMSLGCHEVGSVSCIIDHYWALLRKAVLRTRDSSDAFCHNTWHLSLPATYSEIGQRFCKDAGIDLKQPIAVLHVRDPGYHGIVKQSYRDATVENYRAAIENLLRAGYQVVRLGDRAMPRLKGLRSGYVELPFAEEYQHELDPFFISRAKFMIGSQSGPCAFARAFGTPLLTINAVLHYTLLPTPREMACFKRYYRGTGEDKRELSIEEAIESRIFHFENTFQFERAGISVREASSDEIVAAVCDMIAWLDNPALPETELQKRFQACVQKMADRLAREGDGLELPIADYLGICLPGYRLSPTVAAMREPASSAEAECRRSASSPGALQPKPSLAHS
jgi:putative glycosyltransferase (TIGR04372 family)